MMDGDDAISIRDLTTLDDYLACLALQDETWGDTFSERVPPAILRVSQRIGGVCAGAFDAQGELIAFVFGMTGVRDGKLVHWSDMLAVREGYRGRGLGKRLKLYQRDQVRRLGVGEMMWTFDPLVARNAHFNLNVLGALPIEYVEDMYGSQTGSSLHGGLPTDRFIVCWDLRSEVKESAASAARGLRVLNPTDHDGLPTVDATVLASGGDLAVQIPRELPEEQRRGEDRALRWRLVVRNAIVGLLGRGYRVRGFMLAEGDRLPAYLLTAATSALSP